MALDPSAILVARGLTPDPWQRDFLFSRDRQILLNCSRQSGKSTVVSALALHAALFTPGGLVLLLSPSQRQSAEIFRKVHEAYVALGRPIPAVYESQLRLELANGARVVCLPGREETIRSFGGVTLLVLDEAARIPDRLVSQRAADAGGVAGPAGGAVHAVRPARLVPRGVGGRRPVEAGAGDVARLPAHHGRLHRRGDAVDGRRRGSPRNTNAASTPARAWFIPISWTRCCGTGRRRRRRAAAWAASTSAGATRSPRWPACWTATTCCGSTGSATCAQTPLHEHAAALRRAGRGPRSMSGTPIPPARTEIAELRASGLTVRRADNDIRLGVAATAARLRTGRLKVHGPACPQLLDEARLYRYPSATERASINENPVDEHNHALVLCAI